MAERLLLLVASILVSACVRWGVSDDEYYTDGDYDSSTSYEGTTSTSTSTSSDPGDSSGGEDTTGTANGPTRTPRPWPEPWSFSADSRLVVWGKSGIPTANLEMFANTFYSLAGVDPGTATLTMAWIGDCDPRIDVEGCMAGDVQPFFDMVDSLGTIEFTTSMLEPSEYDVVIADFCGPVDGQQIAGLLAAGEGVLILGDRSCTTDAGSSAVVANETIAHFGVRFGVRELDDPRVPVPPEDQSGVLEGVTSLEAQGLALQQTIEPVVVVLETPDGVVLSRRSER